MAYCSKCGSVLREGDRFCSACGNAVSATVAASIPAAQTSASIYSGEGYGVMLVDNGCCPAETAADLISDTCGYTDAEAMMLVSNAPTFIARGLNQSQAVYLAQSLTEYGMEASIYDRYGSKTLTCDVDSVFDSTGAFLTNVAASLGLIGIANRITHSIKRLILPTRPAVYRMPKPVPYPPVRRQMIPRSADQVHRPAREGRTGPNQQHHQPPHGGRPQDGPHHENGKRGHKM